MRLIYTPDFEVIFVNGLSCYYEIKYQADINRVPNFDLWFSDVRKAAKKNNKELRLVTDVLIRRKFRYENLCLLFKYSKYELDKQYVSYVKLSLCNKSMLIVDLIRNHFMNADFQQIYRLLWDKVLITDIDSRILSKYQSVSLNSGQIK